MSFAETLKAYLEVGILGLSAVVLIILLVRFYNHSNSEKDMTNKELNNKNNSIENKLDSMIELIKTQNQDLIEYQMKNNDLLINSIINHIPSAEENAKLTDSSYKIDKLLQDMLVETSSSRAYLVQYHNGGKGINKQSFLKMSTTNEQVQIGVKPYMQEFKDQFRSTLAYFTRELNDNGYCYIEDIDDIQEQDASMYDFMQSRGVEAQYGYAILDNAHTTIAFICIEYIDKSKADLSTIDTCFTQNIKAFETLLNQ